MKKLLCILLSIVLVMLASCSVADDEVITGDVKESPDAVDTDFEQKDETQESPDVSVQKPENQPENQPEDLPEKEQEPQNSTLEQIMEKLGVIDGEGGEFEADAYSFVEAVKTANKGTVAEYTASNRDYYSFLDSVEISSYEIFPVRIIDEIAHVMDSKGMYFRGDDMYLVDLDVKQGDGEYFREGHNLYFIALGFDAVAGGLVRAFVPAETAEEYMYYNSVSVADKTQTIIKEFLSLYPNEIYDTKLYEGKNYPEDFDFTPHVHLVTHLMARNGAYGAEPPYTLDEINAFLSTLFNGNEGIVPDGDNWTLGIRYGVSDEDEAEGRIYGCSWGHGGTTVEHSILDVKNDDGREIYTVQLYADYSYFAKSKLIEITFENTENDVPTMILVTVLEDTGNKSAVVSV